MRLLILTQAVDTDDPVLGFFHGWIERLATHFESISVICLKKGKSHLPDNVSVYSLGKEEGKGRITYLWRFFKYIFLLRKEYEKVFVHMNQEYIWLAGWFWRLFGKEIYFWRNHVYGNMFTRIACWFTKRIFYTSPDSFTSRYKQSLKMPVGISVVDMGEEVLRKKNQFLVISRITPIKKIDHIVNSFVEASEQVGDAELYVYGGPTPSTVIYDEKVRACVKGNKQVHIMGPVLFEKTRALYKQAAFFINMTGKGSFDKTLLEALAAGALPISNNPVMKDMLGESFYVSDDSMLVDKIICVSNMEDSLLEELRHTGYELVKKEHSLDSLIDKLLKEIRS